MEKYDSVGDHIAAIVEALKLAAIGAVAFAPLLIVAYLLS
jgi:hypothetical protein